MYTFTEDCLIGITEIDEEHRRLFAMINEGMQLLGEDDKTVCAAVNKLLRSLEEYAATHFAHEEAYMQSIGDPELKRQKREHAQFASYIEKSLAEEIGQEKAAEKLEDLLKFLARWLYRHILSSDMMIGQYASGDEADMFAFTDAYRTGIGLVDEEHEHLFEIIRETHDLIYEEYLHDKYDRIVHIIEELKDYTSFHFTDEENYMESIGYSGLEAQRQAHIAFIDKLNEINLDQVDDNQQEYLQELIQYLLNWLTTHILKMDKKIPSGR